MQGGWNNFVAVQGNGDAIVLPVPEAAGRAMTNPGVEKKKGAPGNRERLEKLREPAGEPDPAPPTSPLTGGGRRDDVTRTCKAGAGGVSGEGAATSALPVKADTDLSEPTAKSFRDSATFFGKVAMRAAWARRARHRLCENVRNPTYRAMHFLPRPVTAPPAFLIPARRKCHLARERRSCRPYHPG